MKDYLSLVLILLSCISKGCCSALFPVAGCQVVRHGMWPDVLLGITLGHLWVHHCHQNASTLLPVQLHGHPISAQITATCFLWWGACFHFQGGVFYGVESNENPHKCHGGISKGDVFHSSGVGLWIIRFGGITLPQPSCSSSSSLEGGSDVGPPCPPPSRLRRWGDAERRGVSLQFSQANVSKKWQNTWQNAEVVTLPFLWDTKRNLNLLIPW